MLEHLLCECSRYFTLTIKNAVCMIILGTYDIRIETDEGSFKRLYRIILYQEEGDNMERVKCPQCGSLCEYDTSTIWEGNRERFVCSRC